MAGESIATARVDLVMDTRNYDLAVERAKNKVSDFSTEAQAAYQRLEGAQKRATDRLINYVQSLERSTEAQRLYTAAAQGVPSEIWTEAAARIDAVRMATEMAEAETRQLAEAMQEAARWNAEFDKHRANLTGNHADAEAAQQAWRRAEATEALTLALMRQEAAEAAMRDAAGWEAEEEKARLAWRRAEATEALTLALMREEAAEEAMAGQADFDRQRQAAQLAWRRAEATEALTLALERQEALEANERWIKGLERQTAVLGMSTAELLEYEAAERGISAQAAPLIAAFREKEKAIRGQNAAMQQGKKWNNEYNMSQKQLEFAMRGLPAQFTDIFISLQGGQNPLTVLLQQGGQIKDMFNGVANAVKVVSGELLKLAGNPYVVVTAAVAAFALAVNKAQERQFELVRGLIESGNAAGTTAEEIERMAVAWSQLAGISRSEARAAMSEVVSSGRISAQQFDEVSRAVVLYSNTMGVEADKIVTKFGKIADKPVEALLELNKTENFLTEAQYQRIEALEEEGDVQELVAEATRIYAEHLEDAARQARNAMPYMKRGWEEVKDEISDTWQALQDFAELLATPTSLAPDSVGGFLTEFITSNLPSTRVRNLTSDLRTLAVATGVIEPEVQFAGIYAAGRDGRIAADTMDIEARRKRKKEAEKQAERDQREWARVVEQGLDDRERQLAREKEIIELGKRLGKTEAEVQEQIAASRAKFEASKSKRGGRGNNALQREQLAAFKNQLEEENALLKAQSEMVKAEYAGRAISMEEYYSRMIELTRQEFEAFERNAQAQINYLRTQKDTAETRTKIADLESEVTQRRIAMDGQVAKLQQEQINKTNEQERSLRDYVRALEEQTTALARQQEAELIGMGLSTREAELIARITQLYQKQADELLRLEDIKEREGWSDEQYQTRIDAVRKETELQVQVLRDGYDAMTKARADVGSAWSSSVRDFTDEAYNLAGQTREVFGTVTSGITNAFVNLRREGKLAISDIGDALADLLIQFGTNQILSWVMGMFAPGTGGASMKSLNVKPNALGGVYDSPSLSSYSNSVVSQPTVFAFAKGAGLMGEAGPEAIMPLQRDSAGRLGVQAIGGAATPNITINVHGAPSQPSVAVSQDQNGDFSIEMVFDQIESRMASGVMMGSSKLGTAIKKKYNLREA